MLSAEKVSELKRENFNKINTIHRLITFSCKILTEPNLLLGSIKLNPALTRVLTQTLFKPMIKTNTEFFIRMSMLGL